MNTTARARGRFSRTSEQEVDVQTGANWVSISYQLSGRNYYGSILGFLIRFTNKLSPSIRIQPTI